VSGGGLNPIEANELRRTLRDTIADAAEKGNLNYGDMETLSAFNNLLKEKLNLIPDFKASNELYEEVARKIPGAIGGKGIKETVEIVNPITGQIKTIKTGTKPYSEKSFAQVQTDISKLINSIEAGGTSKKDQIAAFQLLEKNLNELKETKPEILKEFGLDPDKLLSTIKKEADIAEIGRGIFGIKQGGSEDIQKKLAQYASPSGFVYRTAGTVGKAEAAMGKAGESALIKTPVELSKALYSLPVKGVENLGKIMSGSSSNRIASIGKELADAAARNDIGAMQRVQFLILSDPKLKREISPLLGEE